MQIDVALNFVGQLLGTPPDVVAQGSLGIIIYLVLFFGKKYVKLDAQGQPPRWYAWAPWVFGAGMNVIWTFVGGGDWNTLVKDTLTCSGSALVIHNIVTRAIGGK